MKEAWWVIAAVGLMMLVGVARALPFMDVLRVGQATMLYGAGIGVPLEVAYFAALGVSLRMNRTLPKGWFWRPFDHHHLLSPRQRLAVLPFYVTGALSFALATLGILIVLIAIAGVSFDA